LDDLLLNKPEKTFKELIFEVFRNSTMNEALHYEVVRALEKNTALIDSKLQDLT